MFATTFNSTNHKRNIFAGGEADSWAPLKLQWFNGLLFSVDTGQS